jgi:hypothetical protein
VGVAGNIVLRGGLVAGAVPSKFWKRARRASYARWSVANHNRLGLAAFLTHPTLVDSNVGNMASSGTSIVKIGLRRVYTVLF